VDVTLPRVPILECHDLTKTFPGGVEAVRGVSFEIAEGEVFGLLGPNGAGKTTTMRMLGTLLEPTSGTARVAGHDVAREPNDVFLLHTGATIEGRETEDEEREREAAA
jgi:ABC-type multidrug transport system ATPase subunit